MVYLLQNLRKRLPQSIPQGFGFHLSLLILVLSVVSFLISDIFSYSDDLIGINEVNLSGKWKVRMEDKKDFAKLKFDDSAWCKIGVPMGFLLPKGSQGGDCKDFFYDRKAFQNKTFWYRKTFELNEIPNLEEPSLFLGSIKDRSRVYLNEQLLGIFKKEDSPIIVLMNKDLLRRGQNILSIRVESGSAMYPGIHHAYERGVVLGEYQRNIQTRSQKFVIGLFRPLISFIISIFCLSILLVVMYLYRGRLTNYQWLAIYFGGGVLHSQASILGSYFGGSMFYEKMMFDFSFLALVFGTAGFGAVSFLSEKLSHKAHRFLLALLVSVMGFYLFATVFDFPIVLTFKKTVTWVSVSIAFALLGAAIVYRLSKRMAKLEVSQEIVIKMIAMLFVSVYAILFYLVLPDNPYFQHFSLVSSALGVVIIFMAVKEYLIQDRALSFFGRFVRPGLKNMLQSMGNNVYSEQKVFRGREVPVVKIDIVGHTQLTYSMPYGLKRLFQDLWYSRVDACFQELAFVDKNVGDGSIYCIKEDISETPCLTVLKRVVDIRDRHVPEFWKEFKQRAHLLIESEPELRVPYQAFMRRYQERYGHHFWDYEFKIYAALVFGFVDEGLWGLLGQSHYDVQGDLITLAARLESAALPNEIIIDEKFYYQLESETNETAKLAFRWRTTKLKGLGQHQVASLESWLDLNARALKCSGQRLAS